MWKANSSSNRVVAVNMGMWYSRSNRPHRARAYEFVDAVKGGVVPREYIPAVDKGIQDTLKAGILAGYPVVDVKVTLTFGSYHDVELERKRVPHGRLDGVQGSMRRAKRCCWSPSMAVEVETPEEFMGNVMAICPRVAAWLQGMEDLPG